MERNPAADTISPSEAQLRAIDNLARRQGISAEDLENMAQQQFGTSIQNLTNKEAAGLIYSLQQS